MAHDVASASAPETTAADARVASRTAVPVAKGMRPSERSTRPTARPTVLPAMAAATAFAARCPEAIASAASAASGCASVATRITASTRSKAVVTTVAPAAWSVSQASPGSASGSSLVSKAADRFTAITSPNAGSKLCAGDEEPAAVGRTKEVTASTKSCRERSASAVAGSLSSSTTSSTASTAACGRAPASRGCAFEFEFRRVDGPTRGGSGAFPAEDDAAVKLVPALPFPISRRAARGTGAPPRPSPVGAETADCRARCPTSCSVDGPASP
mmetsp:Transcript_54055/g.166301  ORF Transcript_54055/g.166301 Transcript_54055/m.166301 type:complete len:272 (+) Transcript_54055:210-1025(+)